MPAKIVSPKTYLAVWIALLILLAITFGAYFVPLGPINFVINLAVAICKAALVVLFFMDVRYGDRQNWVFSVLGFYWLAILIGLTLSDYLTRGWVPLPGK